MADGYTIDTGSSTSFQDGALHTGDAALMLDGELFVLGRIGDSMKIRGRTVFVEDVEAQVNATEGIASRKVVVLAGADGSRNTLAAIVEAKRGAWVDEVARILEAEAGGDAQVKVLASPPRTIQRTSSGKPRRRLMWKDLLNGSMPGEVVFTNGSSETDVPVLSRGIGDPGVELFRDRVRALIDRYVSPLVDEAEAERRFPREAIEELGREGLFRERWAGGDHGDAGKSALICEELARRGTGGVGVGVSVQLEAVLATLRRYGTTDELQALTEAGARRPHDRLHRDAPSAPTAPTWRRSRRPRCARPTAGGSRARSATSRSAPSPTSALVLAREQDTRTASIAPSLTLFAVPAAASRSPTACRASACARWRR